MYKNIDRVGSLWIGKTLSKIEILSIQSFISNGHSYHLYVYDDIDNVPSDVKLEDANSIISKEDIFYAPGPFGGKSLGAFSDYFRYKMLKLFGGWWVDTDIICMKPFCFEDEYVFAYQRQPNNVNLITTGVIKFPKDCVELNYCIDYCEKIEDKSSISWCSIGPFLLDYVVKKYNLENFVKGPEVFMPINWWDSSDMFKENTNTTIPNESYSVHLWNSILSSNGIDKNKSYHTSSLFEKIKNKINIGI